MLAVVAIAMAQSPAAKEKRPSSEPEVLEITGATRGNITKVPLSRFADRKVNKLLDQWKAAKTDADRNRIENELRVALVDTFHARCDDHEREIEQLEAKVKQLREQLALRREKEADILDFRFQQLLREAQGLGWGTEAAQPATGQTATFATPVQQEPNPKTINAETKVFSLESGAYTLKLTVTFDSTGRAKSLGETDTGQVNVKNEDGEITILKSDDSKSKPMSGELQDNEFSGSVSDAGILVRFKGKLTANNKISGDVTGEDNHGQIVMKGTFKLFKVKIFSLESGKYTLTLRTPPKAVSTRATVAHFP